MRLFLKITLPFFFSFPSFFWRGEIFAQDSTKHCCVNGIGIKSGVTISHLIMKNSPIDANGKTNNIYTPYFALTTEFFHHKNFRLASDIGFISKGGEINEQYAFGRYYMNSKSKTTLNFFSWNIVSMAMLSISKFSPYIFAGPRMDYFHYDSSKDEIFYSDTKSLYFGMVSGLGVNYRINKRNMLLLETNMYLNFYPLYESYELPPPNPLIDIVNIPVLGKLNDRSMVISVGYKYLLNDK